MNDDIHVIMIFSQYCVEKVIFTTFNRSGFSLSRLLLLPVSISVTFTNIKLNLCAHCAYHEPSRLQRISMEWYLYFLLKRIFQDVLYSRYCCFYNIVNLQKASCYFFLNCSQFHYFYSQFSETSLIRMVGYLIPCNYVLYIFVKKTFGGCLVRIQIVSTCSFIDFKIIAKKSTDLY